MATLARIRALWDSFPGEPGYTNWYYDMTDSVAGDLQTWADQMQTFFTALQPRLPTNLSVSIDPEVAQIDSSTGKMVGLGVITPGTPAVGTGSGPYSGTSGAVVRWTTNSFKNGRQVRGHTYLVPLYGGAYASDGSISTVTRNDIQDAAEAAIVGPVVKRVIWSRPAKGGSDGTYAAVIEAYVPNLAVVLRTRRT